jgi:putative membrane protein
MRIGGRLGRCGPSDAALLDQHLTNGSISLRCPVVEAAVLTPAAVAFAGALVLLLLDLGPLARHMARHIAVMSVAAPLCAAALFCGRSARGRADGSAAVLWSATPLQIALIWAWHVPAAHSWAIASVEATAAMDVSLFLAAAAFWGALLRFRAAHPWQPLLALLLTGKLACLLGALLVFAPRLLYAGASPAATAHHAHMLPTLADQQLAGLLMIVACPLSYVLAGVVLAARIAAPGSVPCGGSNGGEAGGR